jgi:hypothetical protein
MLFSVFFLYLLSFSGSGFLLSLKAPYGYFNKQNFALNFFMYPLRYSHAYRYGSRYEITYVSYLLTSLLRNPFPFSLSSIP